MKRFDTRVYSVSDFLEWQSRDLLDLSPEFQRRGVWSQNAKSFLIDTVIRGKPIPKVIITQRSDSGGRNIRTVVDGQQRLRAIIEFVDGAFAISRAHNRELSGKYFSNLDEGTQNEIVQYEIGVDLLFNAKYEDILDIFARLNTYTVSLNKQEKFNAHYLGFYKTYAFELGYRYVGYFLRSNVVTKAQVNRMKEAELASDLLMALCGGIQTNKNLESFYKKYEHTIDDLEKYVENFDATMTILGKIYPPDHLKSTNWSRIHLFYTLFTSIAHCRFGIENMADVARPKVSLANVKRIRSILDDISTKFDEYASRGDSANVPHEYAQFINWSRRGTTDTSARLGRTKFVVRQLAEDLKNA